MPSVTRDLTDFYNAEFKEYALYTIHHRAIPTLLDGFKPVHKKIMWTALRKAKSPIKTVALAGYVIAEADYKHGDAAAIDTIVKMAASWRNQINLLEGLGNFGWRMVPEAGAPRYTKVKLSPDFRNWFSDFNALEYKKGDDGGLYEPICYYANVPWFLINGFRGIATGYSCFCHPRNPSNVTKLVVDVLAGKIPQDSYLDIEYPSYDGRIEDGYSIGSFKQLTKKRLEICSLPVEYTVDTYSTKLMKLVDKGVIKDFHKTVAQDQPPFVVELREPLRDPEKTLALRRKLVDETLVFIHKDKLLVFDNIWDAVGKFIQSRLEVASRGLQASRVTKEDMISRIQTKINFVNTLQRRGIEDLKRADLINIIDGLKRPDMRDSLLSISVSRMTDEHIATWTEQISELAEEIHILNQVSATQWWRYNILNQPLS